MHDTYYVIAHFHFVLSLGAVIALFLGLLFFQETIVGYFGFRRSISRNARFHFLLSFFGINLTFTPMHFLGFNLQPRRIPDFPDNFNSWNFLSSIGSGLTLFGLFLVGFLQLYISSIRDFLGFILFLTVHRSKLGSLRCATPLTESFQHSLSLKLYGQNLQAKRRRSAVSHVSYRLPLHVSKRRIMEYDVPETTNRRAEQR